MERNRTPWDTGKGPAQLLTFAVRRVQPYPKEPSKVIIDKQQVIDLLAEN